MSSLGLGAGFHRFLGELRPKLHRYCARMTGSAIDGEDIVQEIYVKAVEAMAQGQAIENLESWLFRVAHNAALDFLRRRNRRSAVHSDEVLDMIADPATEADRRLVAAASLRLFMELPAMQRSSVILMDVIGYSLDEISSIAGTSVPAIKAALHRGRARLRELAQAPDTRPWPALSEAERSQLAGYVDRFNARDFDTIRDMLADEVRLELVNRTRMKGRKEVATYFGNYASVDDWHLAPGLIDGRLALLVRDPRDPSAPLAYFVILEWAKNRIVNIRDFRYARYAVECADVVALPWSVGARGPA